MNFLKQYKSIFSEDIYGNKAMVYHRTKVEDLVNEIYNLGFKPGEGDMYGKGFYGTYDLKSQLRRSKTDKYSGETIPSMKDIYGDIIVKFLVNSLYNFISFDYDQFLKLPVAKKIKTNKNNFIIDQFNHFKVNYKGFSDFSKKIKFTSEYAKEIYNYSDIQKKVDGIIFTGSRDGKVLVCYDTKLLIPLSTSIDDGKSFQKYDNKSKEYLSNVFDTSIEGFHKNFKDQKIPDWLKKAKKLKYEIQYSEEQNIVTWISGTWISGTWKGGTWENGTWEDGTWEDGTWKNGVFKKGDWNGGTFEKGTFGKDAIWKKGDWNGGTFKGIFQSGLWYNGTWEDGTWRRGGIFSEKFKTYIKSFINPNKFYEIEKECKSPKELENKSRG